jgi:hypothetical protein
MLSSRDTPSKSSNPCASWTAALGTSTVGDTAERHCGGSLGRTSGELASRFGVALGQRVGALSDGVPQLRRLGARVG